jgi:DNA-binding response OmpR family regulator
MNKKTILVIEDDSDLNILYQDILGSKYNLLIARDTTLARAKLEENKVDLIILDIMLPREYGDSFLKKMSKDSKYNDIEVLAITILGDVEESLKEIYPKIIYMQKPFKKKELLDVIEERLSE